MIKYFPYTGLGRIVALPFIFILNTCILVSMILVIEKFNIKYKKYVWIVTIIITVAITIGLHPQEYSGNVYKQLWGISEAVLKYEDYSVDDLDRPIYNQSSDDDGYVVALYKFRYQIPLDGTYHVYREYERNQRSYYDTSIKDIHNIPEKLRGRHKLIWTLLQIIK